MLRRPAGHLLGTAARCGAAAADLGPGGRRRVVALVLTLVVVALVRPPGPVDDPDPADQRDGLLLDGPALPREAAGVRFGGRAACPRPANGDARTPAWAWHGRTPDPTTGSARQRGHPA